MCKIKPTPPHFFEGFTLLLCDGEGCNKVWPVTEALQHSCQVEARGEPTDTALSRLATSVASILRSATSHPASGSAPCASRGESEVIMPAVCTVPPRSPELLCDSLVRCWPRSSAPQPYAPCRPPPPLFYRTNLLIAHACPCCRSHNAVARRHEVPMPTTKSLRISSTYSVEVAEAAAARQAAAEAAAAACRAAAASAAPAVPRADSTMQEEEEESMQCASDESMQYASDESMLEEDDDHKGPAQEEDVVQVDLYAAWSSWQAFGGGGPAESKGKEAAEEQSLREEEMEEEEAHHHEPTVNGMCVSVRACVWCMHNYKKCTPPYTPTHHAHTHTHTRTHPSAQASLSPSFSPTASPARIWCSTPSWRTRCRFPRAFPLQTRSSSTCVGAALACLFPDLA